MAAAAWSWVENILQLAQRTSAPSSTNVSINTAVSTVMCNEPVSFLPANGFSSPYFLRVTIRPGISFSAIAIAFRPSSARSISATLCCNSSTMVLATVAESIKYSFHLLQILIYSPYLFFPR